MLKTASNCIIALHVTNGVKENKRTEKAEDLNFDSLTIITCKPNGRCEIAVCYSNTNVTSRFD